MQVIKDWKQIKDIVDQNYEYAFIGFTRSNLFNYTHDYLYEETIKYLNSNRKLFGCAWDNNYDIRTYNKETNVTPSVCLNEEEIVQWFSNRQFEYLFLPDVNFIHELIAHESFPKVVSYVKNIMKTDGYIDLFPNYYKSLHIGLVEFILIKHFFLFGNVIEPRVFNKTCQLFTPDGTFGFIYKDFMTKYCGGGEYPLLPLIRKPDGLVFEAMIEKVYPQNIKDLFLELVPSFDQFRIDHNVPNLKNNLVSIINKPKDQRFNFVGLDVFCNKLTFNKYVWQVQIKNNVLRIDNQYNIYRLWEFDNGF